VESVWEFLGQGGVGRKEWLMDGQGLTYCCFGFQGFFVRVFFGAFAGVEGEGASCCC
jgi:hypothetical protein